VARKQKKHTPAEVLGANIRLAREKCGYSVVDFAAKIGANPQSVYRWERGGAIPEVDTLERIASELSTSVSALFSGV
jgi:transcriptional regulator with XRE-family HTH domain